MMAEDSEALFEEMRVIIDLIMTVEASNLPEEQKIEELARLEMERDEVERQLLGVPSSNSRA